MAQFYSISKKKAEAISSGIFLIALGLLFYFNAWWPGILLAMWAFLATRQSLTGRHFDAIVTTFILVGLFTVMTFQISWAVLGPLLFMVGGFYIIFREYYFNRDPEGEAIRKLREAEKRNQEIRDPNRRDIEP